MLVATNGQMGIESGGVAGSTITIGVCFVQANTPTDCSPDAISITYPWTQDLYSPTGTANQPINWSFTQVAKLASGASDSNIQVNLYAKVFSGTTSWKTYSSPSVQLNVLMQQLQ